MKNLVICNNCEQGGTKSILGEVTPEGYFAIMRFHNGFTRIIGKDFAVVCGNCGEPNYIRKEQEFKAQVSFSSFTFGTI